MRKKRDLNSRGNFRVRGGGDAPGNGAEENGEQEGAELLWTNHNSPFPVPLHHSE